MGVMSLLWIKHDVLPDADAAVSPEHGAELQAVSQPLSLLRILRPGGLPFSRSRLGPHECPTQHLAAGLEREQADGGPQQILHGAVVTEDPADVQQQHPNSAATGTKKTDVMMQNWFLFMYITYEEFKW